ncbi:MFS transporter [Bacillus sp. CGMCC 1.60114]|uniref:MFS transporter n=1 Tax=unclassified Bacillus (in: firmicutes) TaxID=185979 RepID=UPI00363993EC
MKLQYNFKLYTVFEHWPCEKIITEETQENAKYEYYKQFSHRFWDMPYTQFLKFVRCENIGLVNVEQLFSNEKSFRRMCKKRRITFAYLGMRVQVLGRMGTIIGNHNNDLSIVFDGDTLPYSCDPRFEIAYFDKDGQIIKDNRKGVYAV